MTLGISSALGSGSGTRHSGGMRDARVARLVEAMVMYSFVSILGPGTVGLLVAVDVEVSRGAVSISGSEMGRFSISVEMFLIGLSLAVQVEAERGTKIGNKVGR